MCKILAVKMYVRKIMYWKNKAIWCENSKACWKLVSALKWAQNKQTKPLPVFLISSSCLSSVNIPLFSSPPLKCSFQALEGRAALKWVIEAFSFHSLGEKQDFFFLNKTLERKVWLLQEFIQKLHKSGESLYLKTRVFFSENIKFENIKSESFSQK